MTYPAIFDVDPPPATYRRANVALRVLILAVLAIAGLPLGWIFGFVYLALPVMAAAIVSRRGGEAYVRDWAPKLSGWLAWLFGLYAFLGLLTDRLPGSVAEPGVRFEVRADGAPTVASALWRLVTSL